MNSFRGNVTVDPSDWTSAAWKSGCFLDSLTLIICAFQPFTHRHVGCGSPGQGWIHFSSLVSPANQQLVVNQLVKELRNVTIGLVEEQLWLSDTNLNVLFSCHLSSSLISLRSLPDTRFLSTHTHTPFCIWRSLKSKNYSCNESIIKDDTPTRPITSV